MCELIITGLTYECGPYTIIVCDSNGGNCQTIVVTVNSGDTTGTITYSDGTTETFEDGNVDINIPDDLFDDTSVILEIIDNIYIK